MNVIKKFFLRIFKIKPEKRLISFPLNLENFDKLIIIYDGDRKSLENVLKKIKFQKRFILIKENKENEDEFLRILSKRDLIVDIRKKDRGIFYKYLSEDFPVFGIRKELNFVLPGDTPDEFFGYFLKILV